MVKTKAKEDKSDKKAKATSKKKVAKAQAKTKTGKFAKIRKRIRVPKYFRESWKEVRKVVWPNRRESIRFSFAVIAFTVVFAIFIAIIDTGFNKLVERIFL